MNLQMCQLFKRRHWYLDSNNKDFVAQLDDKAIAQINMAHRWLGKGKDLVDHTPGKVVAELTFAFWVGLLDKGGPRGGPNGARLDYRTTIWRPQGNNSLREAFPLMPQPSRRLLHGHLALLNVMRNRIAHHEPIFDGIRTPGTKTTTKPVPLDEVYRRLLEVASWISPELLFWIRSTSRTPTLLAQRPA
jgi:hypothetical protein